MDYQAENSKVENAEQRFISKRAYIELICEKFPDIEFDYDEAYDLLSKIQFVELNQ